MNKSIVISSVVAAIATWIFMYLDAKLFDTPKSKFTYVKGMAFVAGVVAVTVWFMTGQMSGGGSVGLNTGGAPNPVGTLVQAPPNAFLGGSVPPF